MAQKECGELLTQIQKELATKTSATKGSCFFGLGGRDNTTETLYSEVLTLVNNYNNPSNKFDFK
ncbi:hypothetical protein [Legionella waltersii]|nr:hypothetical protein [Legionella waltersii]